MLTRYASNRALPPRRKNASSVSRSDGTPGKPGWSGNSNGIYSDPERGTVQHRPGENDVDSSDEGIASHDTAPNDFDSDESIDSPSSQPRDIQRPRRSPLRSSWVSASSMMSTTNPPPRRWHRRIRCRREEGRYGPARLLGSVAFPAGGAFIDPPNRSASPSSRRGYSM